MPIIIPTAQAPQGSENWFSLRLGIPTASEFHNFMDSDFNLKQPKTKKAQEAGEINEAVFTYLCTKVAEKYCGDPLPFIGGFGSFATEQGKFNEKMARKWFCLEHECEIQEVAFVTTDAKDAGCSPDGLLGDDAGLEIKSPQMPAQVRCTLEDEIPAQYLHQVHGSLWVTGRKRWHFISYVDGWPVFHEIVERDEAIMQKIGESVRQFNDLLQAAFERLKKMP